MPALVGRAGPLGRLHRVLDETFAGIGRFVLISGEPGVGKTRLALELIDEAARRGACVAVGACWDGAGAPGLWPWVQVLRTLRSALPEDEWVRASGRGHEPLTRLLDIDDGAGPAEFHLFEATLQFLAHLCDRQPLVVLLDDVQWADAASLALVDFLHRHAVHLPLLIVATYRIDEVGQPDHPLRQPLADLAQKAVTIPLAGLDNDGIRKLREDLGVTTSAAEAEHLRRLTGGNPFFVIESVAFRDPTESLGVRRAIDRRIEALGEVEQRVLTVASAVGPEAPDALVASVVGEGRDTAGALIAIERAGLMQSAGGCHTFVHDLVREALRDRLSPQERRALYASIVQAAEAPGVETVLLPSQLAWLATKAVPEIAAERAVTLLEVAAIDDAAHLMHEAAGRHYEEAAALSDDVSTRANLTLRGAQAYHRAGLLHRARDCYGSLLETPDIHVRARALLGLHELGDQAAIGEPPEVMHKLDAIDNELGGSADTALRAEVLAARSRYRTHLLADDRTESRSMAAEALELARSGHDDSTIASCLLAYHDAIWEPGTEEQRRLLADELASIGHRRGDAAGEAQGLLLRMVAELESGDPAFIATHKTFDAVAEASMSPRLQFVAASRRGMVAALRGELPEAQVEIDAARALGERIGEPDAIGMWCDQRWQVARHAGDDDTVGELLETLRAMGDPHWMIYDAIAAIDRLDANGANRLAPQVAALGERWPRWAARLWDVFLVHLAVIERDSVRIGELVSRLEADAGHWAVLGGGVLVEGSVSLWLGRLEAARENWEAALSWAKEAESSAQRLGAHLWLLEARADRLATLHAMGTVDESQITTAIAEASERGLRPIVERLRALVPAAPTRNANVFRRDQDVWTLAFDGVETRMPDAKGLHDLRTLLGNPHVEIPVTRLATDGTVSVDAAPVLDARAKAAYRRRLDELDRELDRASVRGDAKRGEQLEHERTALLDELRRAAGLGGRDRSIDDERERLRKTVTARIRDTLRRLDDRHPQLAAHLRTSVHTGVFCVYAPSEPSNWDIGA